MELTPLTFNAIKVLSLSAIAAICAVIWTPCLTHFLYKHQLWKKEARRRTITGEEASVFYNLHKNKEINTPRFGGLLIWITTLGVIFFFWLIAKFTDVGFLKNFNFLSRGQTWLPLFALVTASLLGLIDDILQVTQKGKYIGGGMTFRKRLFIIILIGIIGGWWFYYKLGWDTIHIPLLGDFFIGIWYIPLFVLVMVASWSGGIIDGLDGLAGGTFASIFGAFGIIAFSQGKIDLACFCAVILGTLFAFLWFNIPPARFYMGETGILGLTSAMAVVAFLTDSVVVLPIIAGLLVLESGSVILQLLSKKIRKKKIFLCTPIHHHFEAKGWPSYKVTMRFWIIGVILALIGVVIRLLG
ncbi:phospho-N-acetylmuramoyl-pentapeptide-transferase [bacterium]|nr:phospho-N-acetylmuramoyl-pentapeptide-transferase [bacterium]